MSVTLSSSGDTASVTFTVTTSSAQATWWHTLCRQNSVHRRPTVLNHLQQTTHCVFLLLLEGQGVTETLWLKIHGKIDVEKRNTGKKQTAVMKVLYNSMCVCVRVFLCPVSGVFLPSPTMNNASSGRKMCWRSSCYWSLIFPSLSVSCFSSDREGREQQHQRKQQQQKKLKHFF